VFKQRSAATTMLVTAPDKLAKARRRYASLQVEVVAITAQDGEIQLSELMRELARRGCSTVMIEGGAHLAGSALRARVVDRVAFFLAPKIIGGGLSAIEGLEIAKMRAAIKLSNLSARQIGPDWLMEAELPRRGAAGS
jgi:diaminohydroxyphosphoribosylaminopyrimidine deaminase/5-amino-6-(5-phosphoribosylamino)uracil reductase